MAQEVIPSPSARNFGIVFDGTLKFKIHISGISRACYYHIHDMRRMRRFLTPSAAKTIATSLICSKLDYCNSVLFNVTEKEISKLQGVQNCLARVVTKSPRFRHTRVRTAVGSRAFSVAATRLCNELPSEIRSAKTQISFRRKLKTYFFGKAFST